MIVSLDGKVISGAAFEHYWKHRISHHTPNVEYVHVIQKSKNKLTVEMVRSNTYSNEETEVIIHELRSLLGNDIEIEFKALNSIPTGNKWRFTTSEILGSI